MRYLGAPLTWKDPPTASWPGLRILHCPSLLEQRVAPKGLPSKSSYLRPIPVNFSHQTRCCSFVSVTSPLQPPSLRHAAQLRWGVIFLQKCEGKVLAFTIFCNLRRACPRSESGAVCRPSYPSSLSSASDLVLDRRVLGFRLSGPLQKARSRRDLSIRGFSPKKAFRGPVLSPKTIDQFLERPIFC